MDILVKWLDAQEINEIEVWILSRIKNKDTFAFYEAGLLISLFYLED